MPELPEVETLRCGVDHHITGRRMLSVELRRKHLRWPIPVARARALAGQRCLTIERRAKYLLLHFDGSPRNVAIIHLGMSGQLFVDVYRKNQTAPAWQTHEHWRMQFEGRLLRYVDTRRFGMLDVISKTDIGTHPLLASLGPEPLGDAFTASYLHRISRRRKISIKTLIMNAKLVVGVGNIYASEACHRAGLRPRRAAGSMTHAQCFALVESIRAVLTDAIRWGGTTIRDYRGIDQEAGYFAQKLRVYGLENEPCLRCATIIRRVVEGGRSTYYCPTCQA